jgi:hypothetical protein
MYPMPEVASAEFKGTISENFWKTIVPSGLNSQPDHGNQENNASK